jgi:hypothetical protein
MNKKLIILSIITIILVTIAIVFITNIDNETNDNINDDEIILNDISLFIGIWDDLFYSLDGDSNSTWEFYENNSIKNSTTGLPYGGNDPLTIVEWHEYKLEDGLIYLKFDSEENFQSYKYVFSNNNNHLSIYEIKDVLEIPIISLNRIS